MNINARFAITLMLSVAIGSFGLAYQGFADNTASEFEYPELLVTPSASKRLETEAQNEGRGRFTTQIPIQSASLLVAIAGGLAINDGRLKSQSPNDAPMAKWAGIGALSSGLGWLTITGVLSTAYNPYTNGWAAVKNMPTKTKRQQLEREREAEERLAAPARLGSRLKWLSIFTNVAMSTFVISASDDNVTRVAGLLATLASFSPLIFDSTWNETYERHEEYRKRIYGPLGEVGLIRDPWAQKTVPAMLITWNL